MNSYVWDNGWVPTHHPPAGFDCADSWRHSYGHARGLALHKQRFIRGVGALPPGLWEGAISLLDASEDLFPRISVHKGEFRFDIRPAPPARTTTDLTLTDAPDPRMVPLTKGPDLNRLAEHRRRYALPGTDDVIVGDFAETTTGALLGCDGDTLVIPTTVHLPSITQTLVTQRALETGLRVVTGTLDPTSPVWFLNALHGVSPVRRIVTLDEEISLPRHLGEAQWRNWWWSAL